MMISDQEKSLGIFLRDLPREFNHRYTDEADSVLKSRLFRSLVGNDEGKLNLLFPNGVPEGQTWVLRDAQGAVDGAEYTAAAKGHPCGHIFKAGESTYHCKTCAADDTCVLCARCFAESDHEGHMVYISVSPGNSGCCDCADDEAWVRPVHCAIHTTDDTPGLKAAGKTSQAPTLPDELLEIVRMTIAKAFDYMCDVFSCSPEQLRLPKTEDTVRRDELLSRLTSRLYGGAEIDESDEEYALVLWNDEKHTVTDVQNQVAKACRAAKSFGLQKAMEVNDIGRSIIHYSKDLAELLRMAAIIEQLKVTVTVRSARDTFREQMCSSIVDWIADISGCSIASDPHVLRNTICEELLRPWRMGSEATNAGVGEGGIDDHEHEDNVRERRANARWFRPLAGINVVRINVENDDEDDEEDVDDDDDGDDGDEVEDENDMTLEQFLMADSEDLGAEEAMDLDQDTPNPLALALADTDMDLDLIDVDTEGPAENLEATIAGYPAPPLPPSTTRRRTRSATLNESDDGEQHPSSRPDPPSQPSAPFSDLPKTPKVRVKQSRTPRPARYWLETPEEYRSQSASTPAEDLWQRVRLDYLILYDLRLWKTLRVNLRHLYISTVVTVPQFKRILGLRFAGLYTMLAQLYLIADREPDHSIINLSVQMLTTPSITAEVVERGNFLTNLLAILYTFLTTRQVGFPKDVNPSATLAFDAGAVTNRRMFHFFIDTRYMFQSAFVQEKVRNEPRYLMQFLDLVKLHQGICPNVRAVGEHVEYEADAWISATMIIKEINRLCRQVAEAFRWSDDGDMSPVQNAIRHAAQATFINAFGLERNRFPSAEAKEAQTFVRLLNKKRPHFSQAIDRETMCRDGNYSLPEFKVATGAMSFHHPLHYLLSWLLEAGNAVSREDMLRVLQFTPADFKDPWQTSWKTAPQLTSYDSAEIVTMLFEHPLRVCAWLAQMRAGMWVRNGVTLRHQMHQYRGTTQRDVSYQRDIFMLQAGLVLCGNANESLGERFLAQIVDRFDLSGFTNGAFDLCTGYDEQQRLDVTEEFFHLLIILLSERQNLLPGQDNRQHVRTLQRDIAHVLCFKPLSFSEVSARLTDRVADSEEFDQILESMTDFRAPEGLNDSGTFELHSRFIETIDPYYAYYNRNQREEAETIYREYMAKKTGKTATNVVFEPQLQPITSGLFQHLGAFTQTSLFNEVIYWGLEFSLRHNEGVENAQITRIETLLHVILHLTLLAVLEDATPKGPKPMVAEDSFVRLAISVSHSEESPDKTIMESLLRLSKVKAFASCAPKIQHILKRMSEKWPGEFVNAQARLLPDDGQTATEAESKPSEDKEAKKKAALERQARVMAQFKAQQTSFMENQGLDWEADDYSDMEEGDEAEGKSVETKVCPFPKEPCILCQEDTDDNRVYGTFAFIAPSKMLRQTPLDDKDYVKEVLDTPENLDQSADAIRPFGVAKHATESVEKVNADGSKVVQERRGVGKGFPHNSAFQGPVLTSCGHIMHFSCFEAYLAATNRRHAQHISRAHPERPDSKEFICPLCKALGNTFLPIIWKDKHYRSSLILDQQQSDFNKWMESQSKEKATTEMDDVPSSDSLQEAHLEYMRKSLVSSLASFPQAPGSSQNSEIHTWDHDSDIEPPEDESRSILPDIVRRAAAEFGINAPGLETLTNLQPRLESLTNLASRIDARTNPATPTSDLKKAYNRIEDSLLPIGALKPNTIRLEPGTHSSMIRLAETLCNTLAFTLSSVEIAYRGVVNPVDGETGTLLDTISEQNMKTLRILSETVRTATATAALKSGIPEYTRNGRLHNSWTGQLKKVLGAASGEDPALAYASLLGNELFTFFTNCAVNEVPMGSSMHHILRLCYSAELIKVIFTFVCRNSLREASQSYGASDWDFTGLGYFQRWMKNTGDGQFKPHLSNSSLTEQEFGDLEMNAPALGKLLDTYGLTFLRKALLLTHIHFGVDFSDANVDPEMPEVHRLAKMLRLPTPQEVVAQLGEESLEGECFRHLAASWLERVVVSTATKERLRTDAQYLSHPAIFELVGLPKHYDTLTEEAIKRRCPTTGKEVSDPAICLFCGEIFCSQASCCMIDRNKGGCYQHREKCSGNIGVFINIRKCMVLFLHHSHGSWYHAPYLDRHGEVDPTLRRHHQLFLNQKRYDKLLRDAWLSHGIPSVISRRLEGDMNTGGWETL